MLLWQFRTGDLVCKVHGEVQAISAWLHCTSALAALQHEARLFLLGTVSCAITALSSLIRQGMSRVGSILIALTIRTPCDRRKCWCLELWEDDRMIAVFRKKKPN